MTRRGSLVGVVERVAEALGDDRDTVVFVGGITLALYSLPLDPRMTEDVDLAVHADRLGYRALVKRLQDRGFRECRDEDAPACRYELGDEPRILVDLLPTAEDVLGFTNRWYEPAIAAAVPVTLPNGLEIKVIAPLHFIATKLEAFANRGEGDFAASHDLEDAMAVLAASPAMLDEALGGGSDVARFVSTRLAELGGNRDFLDVVHYHFPATAAGRAQAAELAERLEARAKGTSVA